MLCMCQIIHFIEQPKQQHQRESPLLSLIKSFMMNYILDEEETSLEKLLAQNLVTIHFNAGIDKLKWYQ